MSHDLSYLEEGFVINDRYAIERSLGAGGFAVVFEGRDTQIDRNVAIKVMNASSVSKSPDEYEELVERFEREAKLAAKVEHPNVATIFDYGVVADRDDPFIVMELMQGRDLEKQLAEHGAMEAGRALELFTDTLTAVGVAHEVGIVHKDIKPANLFLKNPATRFETLSILDFGVAHISKAVQSRLTRAGELTGTPGYLPPEYAQDQIVSPPLDVYQMALVLVETLTGEAVVDPSQPSSALLAHVQGELPIPIPYLESPFGPILRRALATDPDDRYPNGLEFADDLAELSADDIPELDGEVEHVELCDSDGRMAAVEGTADPTDSDTQFMYGGKDAAPAAGGDLGEEGASRSDIENAPTVGAFDEAAIDEAAAEAGEEPGRDVNLETRFRSDTADSADDPEGASADDAPGLDKGFQDDTTEISLDADDAAEFRSGSSGLLVAGLLVLLAAGGVGAYFLLGVGSGGGSPAKAGTDNSPTAAGAASPPPDAGRLAADTTDTADAGPEADAAADAPETGAPRADKSADESSAAAGGESEDSAPEATGRPDPARGDRPSQTDDEPADRADETEPERDAPDRTAETEPAEPTDETSASDPGGESSPSDDRDDSDPSEGGDGDDDGDPGVKLPSF